MCCVEHITCLGVYPFNACAIYHECMIKLYANWHLYAPEKSYICWNVDRACQATEHFDKLHAWMWKLHPILCVERGNMHTF